MKQKLETMEEFIKRGGKVKQHHSGIALTDCELIDVFSPNRKEYSNN